MTQKTFLITVDTEGDNLWAWRNGSEITTENANYVPRFQALCETFGFKPVYLINYEMAQNKAWMKYVVDKHNDGLCEVGLHIHAWNTPPFYNLENNCGGNPYITEYPRDVISEKIKVTKCMLEDALGDKIVSHRSGRWALNEEYLDALAEHGIEVDCTVTPGLDLSKIPGCSRNCGNDYSKEPRKPYYIHPKILEVPMTTRSKRLVPWGSFKHRLRCFVKKEDLWLRPITKSLEQLIYLTSLVENEGQSDYLEFMLHSSELMPGGSPYFKTSADVEVLYDVLEKYFRCVAERGYVGQTLSAYAKNIIV